MTALRVDWIINTKEGKDFLQNILLTGNLDFFKIDTIQYITEFLFLRFKYVIIFLLLPIYGSAHVSYFFLQRANDDYNNKLFKLFDDPHNPEEII